MIISDVNLKIYYDSYLKQRARSEKYIRSRKGAIRSTGSGKPLDLLTFNEFKTDFIATTYDMPGASGKKVAEEMAKLEVFPMTFKQAQKAAEASASKYGKKYDVMSIYTGQNTDIFKDIAARRSELSAMGKSKKEIAYEIGHEYYGSP